MDLNFGASGTSKGSTMKAQHTRPPPGIRPGIRSTPTSLPPGVRVLGRDPPPSPLGDQSQNAGKGYQTGYNSGYPEWGGFPIQRPNPLLSSPANYRAPQPQRQIYPDTRPDLGMRSTGNPGYHDPHEQVPPPPPPGQWNPYPPPPPPPDQPQTRWTPGGMAP